MSQTTKTYEAMFLLPAGLGDFESAAKPVQTVLERGQAEVLSLKPWDERRLAYDIGGNRRGMYVLTYFKADPERIAEIEHDCQLNETILRVLILRRDTLTQEQIEAETPAAKRAATGEKSTEEESSRDRDERRSRDRSGAEGRRGKRADSEKKKDSDQADKDDEDGDKDEKQEDEDESDDGDADEDS